MAAPNASLEVVPVCRRLSSGLVAAIGFTARRLPCLFPCTVLSLSKTDLPPRSAPRFDLPLGSSSSEFLHVFDPASCLSTRSWPTWGFVPHRDITDPRPLFAGPSQALLRSVLRLSRPLDGLLRVSARELVSSRSRVQGSHPFRGFSPRAAFLFLVGREFPHAVLRSSTHQPKLAAASDRPGSEALLHARARCRVSWCYPSHHSLPSSGSRSLRALTTASSSGYPNLSARDVARTRSPLARWSRSTAFSVSSAVVLTSRHLCPCQPARNFRAFRLSRPKS